MVDGAMFVVFVHMDGWGVANNKRINQIIYSKIVFSYSTRAKNSKNHSHPHDRGAHVLAHNLFSSQ
jgi:hypothetical protein